LATIFVFLNNLDLICHIGPVFESTCVVNVFGKKVGFTFRQVRVKWFYLLSAVNYKERDRTCLYSPFSMCIFLSPTKIQLTWGSQNGNR